MTKLKILLTDDHEIMRDGLKNLLSLEADFEIVGEASDGAEAVKRAIELQPDVILMDLSMPNMNGLQATQAIQTRCPSAKILILTTHEDENYLRQLCMAGATGYVLKRSPIQELIGAIRQVASGGIHLDSNLAREALVGYARSLSEKGQLDANQLSDREKEVLRQIAWGFSNKEIAAKLNISVKTVETYKVRVGEKLGLSSRAEMVRFAAAQGWLSGEHSFMQ